ncbi:MAG: bifunctional 4-hydroxy-2-oxoglutarate aldolase/2-dehydro-3-deoxy-phosphogluconate aldolase [Clostridia bacterium]|nr:bifunctional 4-hydroxy-2-oxoglutarate aldolase/2-dehydro-3-deoxy-phosphogluconate aldolase [Clostridia bacterium]
MISENVRNKVIEAVAENKVISIVRLPDRETLIPAAQALYEGGIRLIEVTFDRSGKVSREEICSMISDLVKHFEGRMCIGAGTVTHLNEVDLAVNAGATFIISPNCDPEIIKRSREIGAVSIPAAFTPTEIVSALNNGADYVKLFPADQVRGGYVKAVSAPISDAKLLAVGGVSAENAGDFMKMGFLGVGVGSNLYNKKLIANGDYAALTELAKQFVNAVK